jgi:phosphate transport system substrate-binding protein
VKDGYIPLPAKVAAKALADLGLSEGEGGNVAKK